MAAAVLRCGARQRRLSTDAAAAWSPQRYSHFTLERLRPAQDLLTRVNNLSAAQPSIIDVGCGAGGPAKLLMARFPKARLLCMDSSPDMLEAARADPALSGRQLVSFECASIEDTFGAANVTAGTFYDLIFANASLHWRAPPTQTS